MCSLWLEDSEIQLHTLGNSWKEQDLSAKSLSNYDQSRDGGRVLSTGVSIRGDTEAFSRVLKTSPFQSVRRTQAELVWGTVVLLPN